MKTLRICLAAALLLAASMTLTAASLQVSHEARSLAQGEAVLLTVASDIPLDRVSAEVFDKEFPLFSEGDETSWKGIVAIDLACRPGSYDVKVRGWTENGSSPAGEKSHTLRVESKEFAERRLKVDQKYVSPPQAEMERINREAALTKELFTLTTPEKYWAGDFRTPGPGGSTSPFGRKNFVNDEPRSPHSGVDLRGAVGTPVKAPASGRIIMAEDLYFAGNTLMIDHGFGMISYLCHLYEIKAGEGKEVRQGEVIGIVGATGRVTGPHLHWTVKILEQRIDPLSLLELDF